MDHISQANYQKQQMLPLKGRAVGDCNRSDHDNNLQRCGEWSGIVGGSVIPSKLSLPQKRLSPHGALDVGVKKFLAGSGMVAFKQLHFIIMQLIPI
jgi:hypothetical protein